MKFQELPLNSLFTLSQEYKEKTCHYHLNNLVFKKDEPDDKRLDCVYQNGKYAGQRCALSNATEVSLLNN